MKQINLSRFAQLNSSENQIQVITGLFIFWAVFFGTMVRLIPIFQADFPLNDGGLFYHMASELIEAGFRLPENTGYNSAGIPFAYPPLGLYGLALLSQVFPLLGWFSGSRSFTAC